MSVPRRLLAGLSFLIAVAIVGSLGFVLVEDLAPVEALYMTVITISTVGFREVGGPFGTGGQLMTIGIVIAGMGAAIYTAVLGLEWTVESLVGGERVVRRMKHQIESLDSHVIICGFGRVGSGVWDRLGDGRDSVVIDVNPERIAHAREVGALAIEGDATHDETLELAGIDRASVLIAAVRSDSDNLVTVLSARAKRPDLQIVARVLEEQAEKKLYLAGANRVVAPQVVGAHRIAALASQPDLAEFIDLMVSGRLVEFRIEELKVEAGSELAGKSLRTIDLRHRAGALVLALEDETGRLSLNPDPDVVIRPGQVVLGIGTIEQIELLRKIAQVA